MPRRADRQPERRRARRRSAGGPWRRAAGRTDSSLPSSSSSARRCRPRLALASSADVDAVLAQRVGDERRRVRVDAREDARVALHERHLRADALEELRELAADRAGAEHDEPRRHLARLGRVDVRPVVDVLEPVERRDRPATSPSRARACRTAARVPSTCDDARARGTSRRRARAPRPVRRATRPARSRRARRRCRASAKIACASSSPTCERAERPVGGRGELRRAQHRLRRHARPVRALAADEAALDHGHLRLAVEPAEGADEMLAGRPSAHYDNVLRQGAT